MTRDFPYVELPGTFRGFLRKSSLWEGLDHMLMVRGTRYHEEYRRFYYQDIQCFMIEKHSRMGSIGWWLFLVVLLLLFIFWTSTINSQFYGPLTGLLAAFIIVRLYRCLFRSCRCSIQTAVSRELLPSPMRLSHAEKVGARLRERIAAIQGDLPGEIPLTEEEALAAVQPPAADAPSSAALFQSARQKATQTKAIRGTNFAIAALFGLLLNSIFTLWFANGFLSVNRLTLAFVGYLLVGVVFVPLVYSLRFIAGLRGLKVLRWYLWATLAFAFLRVTFNLATYFASLGGWHATPRQVQLMQTISGVAQLVVAAAGLLLIIVKWENYRRGELSAN